MADCIYCGKKAGMFKKLHDECKNKHEESKKEIVDSFKANILSNEKDENLKLKINSIATEGHVEEKSIMKLFVTAWKTLFFDALEKYEVIPEEIQEKLAKALDDLSTLENDPYRNHCQHLLVQSIVLREISEGIIPKRIVLNEPLPFNYQKNEKPVWVFKNIEYYEEKTKKHFAGGHHGVSFRVAKGVSLRAGRFKGEPVVSSTTEHVDTGLLAVTDKHLYFSGNKESFRIKFDKIVAFKRYSDGLGIQRDAKTAKPQIFLSKDSWFLHSLAINIANM